MKIHLWKCRSGFLFFSFFFSFFFASVACLPLVSTLSSCFTACSSHQQSFDVQFFSVHRQTSLIFAVGYKPVTLSRYGINQSLFFLFSLAVGYKLVTFLRLGINQ